MIALEKEAHGKLGLVKGKIDMSACNKSPWGVAQLTLSVAPGMWLITTASHGGFYLEPAANDKIPLPWKQVSFKRQALEGFYEEHCDACMVVLTFPHSFNLSALASARQIFNSWMAPKLGVRCFQEQEHLVSRPLLLPRPRMAKTS